MGKATQVVKRSSYWMT